ncbi:MAG: MerR family transcriptional regulator [Burkholderiales bacterium]
MSSSLTIGAIAKAADVNVETIRYYQRLGLVEEPAKPLGGVRRYADATIARVRFIKRAQAIGFTLEEIAGLLKLAEAPDCRGARSLAAHKLELVETRLKDLQRIRRGLQLLIAQCDAGRARSCPIIDSLASV